VLEKIRGSSPVSIGKTAFLVNCPFVEKPLDLIARRLYIKYKAPWFFLKEPFFQRGDSYEQIE
jgi:hypothetical protein